MTNTIFEFDFNNILLGGYDAILGVQWRKQLSPICLDFDSQDIIITWDRKRYISNKI